MDKIYTNFGAYIKNIRKLKGLSQQEVANALNISQSAYSRYEAGTREMNLDVAIDIANYLNFDLGAFLTKEMN